MQQLGDGCNKAQAETSSWPCAARFQTDEAFQRTGTIGGRNSGTVSGTMNMVGNIGGALSPMLVGYILTWSPDNWALTFYVSSGIYLMGAICWLFIDAHTPLERATS